MAVISTRVPAELAETLDAWAAALGPTRSAVVRALIEDAADVGELPSVLPTRQELLDDELQRMRELSRS
jgi:antitoxin component of RelBE/YafQ-DinJ toxin-antitoxin module